ncbi:hypothetical protein HYPSUDRAFT_57049 [Hypholoma sublateritium FD-334 SS-4]|uniref:Uncharacterized protein n=1 Tax=Hypholoma sublateritium (strain FD-334 SS-4) TaxID=945553 RepID=A0A0D2NHX9_HYPSF|nr:hypothetical protein HYPSUDRAFT_57049 [Hypholoma sublateritium FD-334 SS-4]
MNVFPAGARVFFWTAEGQVEYAVVRSSSRLPDGTQILVLQIEGSNRVATLPYSSVIDNPQINKKAASITSVPHKPHVRLCLCHASKYAIQEIEGNIQKRRHRCISLLRNESYNYTGTGPAADAR